MNIHLLTHVRFPNYSFSVFKELQGASVNLNQQTRLPQKFASHTSAAHIGRNES
jgi:hypothetical protein